MDRRIKKGRQAGKKKKKRITRMKNKKNGKRN